MEYNRQTSLPDQIENDDSYLSAEQWQEKYVSEPIRRYEENTRWSEETLTTYKRLLSNLKNLSSGNNTKKIGDALEEVVFYLFDHSGIFKVCKNVKSATNEIDHVLKLSIQGEMLVKKLGWEVFGLSENDRIIISECKNYSKKVGVTYLMKFYSLLKVSDIKLGFFFATNGITGKENSYEDGYGYLKVIRLFEKHSNNQEFYILPFTLEDLDSIESANDFFELVKTKKESLQLSVMTQSLKPKSKHPNENQILDIVTQTRIN